MRVFIVLCDTGEDHDYIIDVFSTEQKAQDFINEQIDLGRRSLSGFGGNGLYIAGYEAK